MIAKKKCNFVMVLFLKNIIIQIDRNNQYILLLEILNRYDELKCKTTWYGKILKIKNNFELNFKTTWYG